LGRFEALAFSPAQETSFPLPQGEGRGEGEGNSKQAAGRISAIASQIPNSERSPKPEARRFGTRRVSTSFKGSAPGAAACRARRLQISGFGFRSAFGLRASGFSPILALAIQLSFTFASPAAELSDRSPSRFTDATAESLAFFEGDRPVFVDNVGTLRSPGVRAEPFRSGPPEVLRAELKPDKVVLTVAGKLFTEYLFTAESKYPYFFPVNGPRSGRSVTTRRTEPYPHHSSLFFGCDKVNGGNYWQEGLERGRIASKAMKLIRAAGNEVAFEQDCRWERPGADVPFDDHRRILVSAPSPDLRAIDFEITLTARNKVRIDKTNHSLFAARLAPELAVQGGGQLINAYGEESERGTFGRVAPWMDARGSREGETEGLAIFCHPKNRWHPAPWFTRDYGFFSPTPLWWLEKRFIEFAPGEKLHLRYRVLVHAGQPTKEKLQMEFEKWSGPQTVF
jgi:hypothetical protein